MAELFFPTRVMAVACALVTTGARHNRMEYCSIGVLEYWINGVLEYWSVGIAAQCIN
jgi:hypothetical protein